MKSKKLYVGNLNYNTTKNEMEALFSHYGKVINVNLLADKGFGFVEMSNTGEAEAALKGLNNKEFKGRHLKIDEARAPERKKMI